MPSPQNIVGSRLKAVRRDLGITQAMLAARCGTLGWDIGENIVTKIETGVRCVTDVELTCIATALKIAPENLLPAEEKRKSVIARHYRD
jgi:transcriptional regulator with XRE-family HTH domain